MKWKLVYLLSLIVFSLIQINDEQSQAGQTVWTEKKIGTAAVRADKAAMRKKWTRAIKYGEKMLEGTVALYGQNHPNYISRLKTVNRYYDKAGRLLEIPQRIDLAYRLSKKYFKPTHDTAKTSRLLFYKILIFQKNYEGAVTLVRENISSLSATKNDAFRKLHYLEQLHGLYGLTNQIKLQENTLLELLDLNKTLVGTYVEDNKTIILNLAKSYCLQNKVEEFKKLMQLYHLKFKC